MLYFAKPAGNFGNEKWGYRINLGCVEQLDALALAENPGPHPGEAK